MIYVILKIDLGVEEIKLAKIAINHIDWGRKDF